MLKLNTKMIQQLRPGFKLHWTGTCTSHCGFWYTMLAGTES